MIQNLTPETAFSRFNTGGEPCSFAFKHAFKCVRRLSLHRNKAAMWQFTFFTALNRKRQRCQTICSKSYSMYQPGMFFVSDRYCSLHKLMFEMASRGFIQQIDQILNTSHDTQHYIYSSGLTRPHFLKRQNMPRRKSLILSLTIYYYIYQI